MKTELDAELEKRLPEFNQTVRKFYERLVDSLRPTLVFCERGDRDCFEDLGAFVVGELAKQAEEDEAVAVEGAVTVDDGVKTGVDAAVVDEIAEISVSGDAGAVDASAETAATTEAVDAEATAAAVEGEASENSDSTETEEPAATAETAETVETSATAESTTAETPAETAEPTVAVAAAQTSTQALSSSKIQDDEMTNMLSGLGSSQTGADTLDNLMNQHNNENNQTSQNNQDAQNNQNESHNSQNGSNNVQQTQTNETQGNANNQNNNENQSQQSTETAQRATGLAAMNTFSISKALYSEALSAYRRNNKTSHRKISKFANMKQMPIFN